MQVLFIGGISDGIREDMPEPLAPEWRVPYVRYKEAPIVMDDVPLADDTIAVDRYALYVFGAVPDRYYIYAPSHMTYSQVFRNLIERYPQPFRS